MATPPTAAERDARKAIIAYVVAGWVVFAQGGLGILFMLELARRHQQDVEQGEQYIASLRLALMAAKEDKNPGPRKKRRASRFNWQRAREAIEADWFGPYPTFDDGQFARMFRVTKTVAEEILAVCANKMSFFWETVHNVMQIPNIDPKAKLLVALKTLAFGVSAIAFVDYFQMGESTVHNCLKYFCQCIRADEQLQQRFMRPMNREDARRVSQLHHTQHGVPGMMGSLDCMHAYWKNCPMAWKGAFGGKEKASSIVLEAFSDYNCFIWHASFGYPGSDNDINILERSPLLAAWLDGSYHRDVDFEFTINGRQFKQLYLLVDGIYPSVSRFVKTLAVPIGKDNKTFASWQESSRKDIERTFGILQRKFHYLVRPFEQWEMEEINDIMLTCILLHNWMVMVRVERDEQETADFYQLVEAAAANDQSTNEDADLQVMRNDDAHYAVLENLNAAFGGGVTELEATLAERKAQFFDRDHQMAHHRWICLHDKDEHVRLRDAIAATVSTKTADDDGSDDEAEL
jgi:Plant transposon protein